MVKVGGEVIEIAVLEELKLESLTNEGAALSAVAHAIRGRIRETVH